MENASEVISSHSTASPNRIKAVPETIARSALDHSAYREIRDLRLQVNQGVAVLRGTLPSYYLKQVAQTTLASTAGIDRVVDHVRIVRGEGGPKVSCS